MLDTNMLIGSDFVTGTEAPEPIVNPKTEEVITNLPDASVAQVDACGQCRREGVQDVVADDARRTLDAAPEARGRD